MKFDCTNDTCKATLEVAECAVRIWCPVCEHPMQQNPAFENPNQMQLPYNAPGTRDSKQY